MLDRFAGVRLQEAMSESRRHYEGLIDKPVVPGFNSEDLTTTPELTPGNRPFFMPGEAWPMDLLKDDYIRKYPESGVAMSPVVPALNIIRDAVQGRPAADGTLEGASMKKAPGVVRPIRPDTVRPSDSDNQFMDIMRSGFV